MLGRVLWSSCCTRKRGISHLLPHSCCITEQVHQVTGNGHTGHALSCPPSPPFAAERAMLGYGGAADSMQTGFSGYTRCWDVPDGNENTAHVQQWGCSPGNSNQMFWFEHTAGNWYKVCASRKTAPRFRLVQLR